MKEVKVGDIVTIVVGFGDATVADTFCLLERCELLLLMFVDLFMLSMIFGVNMLSLVGKEGN